MSARAEPLNLRRIAPVLIILAVAGALYLYQKWRESQPPGPAAAAAGPGEYLFCVWNVENLFDDRDDALGRADEEYDDWFVQAPADRELKYRRLAEILLKMNGGKGPDILCAVEVESKRAAELLAEALNKVLPSGAAPYSTVIMEEIAAGRHIAPAIISRLPPDTRHKPRVLKPQRILVAGLTAGGHELVVYATHWTSRRTDDEGTKREKYADLVYGDSNRVFHSNPKADILVCGDFNDSPDDPAVRDHLRTGTLEQVRGASELRYFNLMTGKEPAKYGTHYYQKPVIYDHVCVSPGLLDNEGWSCDVNSVQTWTDGLIKPGSKQRRPWRFGNRKDTVERGYSDHFPVLVKLKVAGEIVP